MRACLGGKYYGRLNGEFGAETWKWRFSLLRVSPDEIEETELLPTHLRRNYADEKLGILDVRVRLWDGLQINMELQVKPFNFWDERALFYISKMFLEQLKSGDSYGKLKKCIHVSILDFILFPEDERCYRTVHFRDDDTGSLYSDKLELQILELKKLPEKVTTGEEIVNWMIFFNGRSRKEFEQMAKASIYLGEAYDALQKLSADDLKRIEYEAREKELKDYNSQINSFEKRGVQIGKKEGIQLARKVFRLHSENRTNEEIAAECDVSLEEVLEILE